MKIIRNLTITSSLFVLLTGCTGGQSFSEFNNNILSTSASLLEVSQSIRGVKAANKDVPNTTDKTSNKKLKRLSSRTSTAKNTALKTQLFNECMESGRTKLRFDMGKSVEQIQAEKAREEEYLTKRCGCEVEYDLVAAQKMMALGFDGSQASANKIQKDPVKAKKANQIMIQRSLDKTNNCRVTK